MDYSRFKNVIKPFFKALKKGYFKSLSQTSASVIIDGIRTTVDRTAVFKALRDFPDLKDKSDAELIKDLQDPTKIERIKAKFSQEQQRELISLEDKNTVEENFTVEPSGQGSAAGQQQTGGGAQSGGGSSAGFSGMPSTGSFSAPSGHPRIVIREAPQVQPKPEIAVTKGGVVVEKPTPGATLITSRESLTEAGDPSKFAKTSSGQITEAGQPSKLVTTSGGVVKEPYTPPSSIHIADKSGNIAREQLIPSARKFNVPAFKSRISNLVKNIQNFASRANPFIKTNLNRMMRGFGNMLGGLGRGFGGMAGGIGRAAAGPGLSGIYKGGGRLGGGIINAGSKISNQVGSGATRFNMGSKKLIWGLLGIMFLIIILGGLGGSSSGAPEETSTGTLLAGAEPPPAGDLHLAIQDRYQISFDGSFDQTHLLWAWQILSLSESKAPNFLQLLRQKYPQTNVGTTEGVGYRSGNTILFSTRPGSFFMAGGEAEFKQIFIHELSHIIHGARGDSAYMAQIENAVQADGDFLTGYAQGATEADMVCATSNSGERLAQLDEDFSDSVAYYIVDIPELSYHYNCPAKNAINPFRTGKYPNHLNFMRELLGGSNF